MIEKELKLHKLWLNGDSKGVKANLNGANLRGADLNGADLRRANLNGAGLIVIRLPIWTVYVHKTTIRIGCKHYTHDKWSSFTNHQINAMDSQALAWWNKYSKLILTAAKELDT